MRKLNVKISKKMVTGILVAVAAVSVVGCSSEKTVTRTETYTDAEGKTIVATITENIGKNGKAKSGTMVIDPGYTETSKSNSKIANYTSKDGNWSIDYNTEKYFLNDTLGNGEICFNYIGECSGTQSVIVSYYKDKMPDEVLYEKTKGIDDSKLVRGESFFGMDMYWAHYRHIKPENEDPNKGDVVHEGFTAIEHNGGTILLDCIDHKETNDTWYSNKINAQSELLNTFKLLNHNKQTEYAHVPGKYVRKYSEEIEGNVVNIEQVIVMKDDHTCEMSIQDKITGEWTGTEIVNGQHSEEYTIEGDSLYLNMGGNWVEFKKVIQ